jgi:mono/diheme cytochrome c family protein
MKKLWPLLIFILVVIVGLIGYSHATRNKRRHDVGATGADMYMMYCARCHKENGRGTETYPPLQLSQIKLDDFAQLLKQGRGAMPAFTTTFEDKEIEPLFRHVQSLKKQN